MYNSTENAGMIMVFGFGKLQAHRIKSKNNANDGMMLKAYKQNHKMRMKEDEKRDRGRERER